MNQYEFTHKGVRYVSAPPLVEHSCAGCAFNERGCSAPGDEPCKAMKRADGRDVIFIREPALDAHLQTDLALPVAADPPPAPQPSLRIANIGTAQHDEQPLTLEQRVAALEQAFARRITAGTAKIHRMHILDKMQVESIGEIARLLEQGGLMQTWNPRPPEAPEA